MRPSIFLSLAIVAVLSGAPLSASAADAGGLPLVPLGIAIGGFAGLALLGWYVLPGRQRRVEPGPSESRAALPTTRSATDEHVAAALHRRTLRRGRVRLEEDPIIASMGVGAGPRPKPGVSRAQRSARRSPPT